MPRIRTIKPELFMSPQVMNLSHPARLLFIGLITQADDEGRGIADPRKFKAAIFGGDDEITSAKVLELMAEIESQALCITYDGAGHGRLYALPTWHDHQYVAKAKSSAYPDPPAGTLRARSSNGTGNLPEPSRSVTVGSEGSEGSIGKDLTRARASGGEAVDNSARGARRADVEKTRKPTDPEEIEKRRREAGAIAARLAAQAKPP